MEKISFSIFNFLLFVLIFLCNHVKLSVYVRSPKELVYSLSNGSEIESELLDFGHIPFGYSTYGKIYTPQKNDELKWDKCYDFQYKRLINKTADIDESPIFLLDKNTSCSLIDMTYYSEMNGAHIVLFIDEANSEVSTSQELVHKRQINIPSLLINRGKGSIVRKFIEDNPSTEVIIEVDFNNFGVS